MGIMAGIKKMLGLEKKQETTASDALPYQELYEDGTVLTRDMGLLKCWKVIYPDVSMSITASDEASEAVARMFQRRTDGQRDCKTAYWFILHRLPFTMKYDEELTGELNMRGADIEIEKHRQAIFADPGNNLINTSYLCCKTEVDFTPDKGITPDSQRRADETFIELEAAMHTIGATVIPLTCTAKNLTENILVFLKYSCGTEQKPFKCPQKGIANVSSFISSKTIDKGKPMQLGDDFVQMLTVNDFPHETYASMLIRLLNLPFAFRWVTRWIPYNNRESQEKAMKLRNQYRAGQKNLKSAMFEASTGKESQNINTQAVVDTDAVEDVLVNLSHGETLGMLTSTIEVIDPSPKEVKIKAQRVKEVLSGEGFDAIEESPYSNYDAWKSSLPGDTISGRRRPLVTASNLSDIVPFTNVYHGLPYNKYLELFTGCRWPMMMGKLKTREVYYLNLNGGTTEDIGHTFIIGSTGGGKSVFLALMASQWSRYPGSRIILFDKDMSFRNICERTGGAIYNPAADDSHLKFMPLSRIHSKPSEVVEWLEVATESAGVPVTPDITKDFKTVVESWDDSTPTVSRFVTRLRGHNQNCPALPALEKYSGQGNLALLFSGEDDSFNNSSFGQKTMIEMGSLMNMGNEAVFPALQFMFSRIDELFDTDPQPTLLIMDEAWLFINHKVFRRKIKEWLKTLRKKRVFVVLAVQNVGDVDDPEEFLTSCHTRIYLANPELRGEGTPAVKDMYRKIGCTEAEMEIIGHARRKQDYFIQQQEGSALVNFMVDSYQLERVARDGR